MRLFIMYATKEAAQIWLGRPSSDLWFETFELISKNGLVLLDSGLKEKITMKGNCLGAIYKDSPDGSIPSFVLTAWDCKEKKSAVCEKIPTKFHATNTEKPNFPCIPQNQKTRKKRQDSMSGAGIDQFGRVPENAASENSNFAPFDPSGRKNPATTGADGTSGDSENKGTNESSGNGNLFVFILRYFNFLKIILLEYFSTQNHTVMNYRLSG